MGRLNVTPAKTCPAFAACETCMVSRKAFNLKSKQTSGLIFQDSQACGGAVHILFLRLLLEGNRVTRWGDFSSIRERFTLAGSLTLHSEAAKNFGLLLSAVNNMH
jgi:hypothetical protein